LKKINSNKDIKKIINENEIVILYFSNETCGACKVIKNKLEVILESYTKTKAFEIEGEKEIEISAANGVFSFPLLILYVDRKETIRVGRNVDLLQLEQSIKRYYNMVF